MAARYPRLVAAVACAACILCEALPAATDPTDRQGPKSRLQQRSPVQGLPSRQLQQVSAPAVAVPPAAGTPSVTIPSVSQLLQLHSQLGKGRPITAKNVEAAYYVSYAQAGATVPNEPSVLQDLIAGTALVSWQNDTGAAIFAFAANGSNPDLNATEAAYAPLAVQPFFDGNLWAAYPSPPPLSDPVLDLINGAVPPAPPRLPLVGIIANVSSNQVPRRVVCTGYGDGGARAQTCGIWAAVQYPLAAVRVISFGAPTVGNANYAYSVQQLVNLPLLWSLQDHLNVTNATTYYAQAVPVRMLPTPNDTPSAPLSWGQYAAAVIAYYNQTGAQSTVAPRVAATSGGGVSGFFDRLGSTLQGIFGAISNLGDIIDTAQAYAEYHGDANSAMEAASTADAAAARATATGCPVLMCKVRKAAPQMCDSYNSTNNAIAPGSVHLGPTPDTGQQAHVVWGNDTKVATIVFPGSTSRQNWAEDFKIFLARANTSTALDQIYPDVQIHEGFLQSFQSLTDNAQSDQYNISAALSNLSGGAQPDRVIVEGHSLGGAVAAICGVWAALQWPSTDVYVATFGEPMPGNRHFAEAFEFLVGRSDRLVNKLDIVPALPPLDDYVPTPFGRWIPYNQSASNATTMVQDRPGFDFDQYNWGDHSCNNYQASVLRTPVATQPPDVVQALANYSSNGG